MPKNARLFFLHDDAERLQSWQADLAACQEGWDPQFFRFRKDLAAAIAEDEPALFVTWSELRRSPGVRIVDQIGKQHPGVRCVLLAPRSEHAELQTHIGDTVVLLPDTLSPEELWKTLQPILAVGAQENFEWSEPVEGSLPAEAIQIPPVEEPVSPDVVPFVDPEADFSSEWSPLVAEDGVSLAEPSPDVSEEETGQVENAGRRPRPFGFLPISTAGWAAACVAAVLVIAWIMRPRSNAAESSVTALLNQTDITGPMAEALESSEKEMAAIIAEFPDEAPPADPTPAASPTGHPMTEPIAPTAPEPVVASTEPLPDLKLSGIYYKAGVPIAVINGRLWKVGASIEGARLERIERSRVELNWQGTAHFLELE